MEGISNNIVTDPSLVFQVIMVDFSDSSIFVSLTFGTWWVGDVARVEV